MASGKKGRKTRTDFRKNRSARTRRTDWTQRFDQEAPDLDATARTERLSGKGELTRRRTVLAADAAEQGEEGPTVHLEVDERVCRPGRVLSIHGLFSMVRDESGQVFRCATRRLLKTLSTDQRHVIAVGDRVMFRPVEGSDDDEGLIERVEPRHGTICRTSRGRQQILVTNVDQVLIVASAAEPRLKPNLIDRLLIAAEKGGVQPIICINKIDLVDAAGLQPLIGVYSSMGYPVLLLSARTGAGAGRLARRLAGQQTVVAGQSGVGKSSLLNVVDPQLQLRVAPVSADNQKGCHTTTTARLLPLLFGGFVVDTPGIRQFELWDVTPAEVAGFFRDLRPLINLCRFPNCTHTHEADCAVKSAVADGRLDERRYESYCHLYQGEAS